MPELTLPDIERAIVVEKESRQYSDIHSVLEYATLAREKRSGWEACLLELKRRMTPVTVRWDSRELHSIDMCRCGRWPDSRLPYCPKCGIPLNWEGK